MTAHSYAPWEWFRPHGSPIRFLISQGKANTIVREDPDEPISEADARLLVAAPELLALARYVAQRGEGGAEEARILLARIDIPEPCPGHVQRCGVFCVLPRGHGGDTHRMISGDEWKRGDR